MDDEDPGELPYRRFDIPKLGFENYWYPIVTTRDVKRRPRAVRLLGNDIVLFRDGGKLFALEDRCPPRGLKLSAGEREYAATRSTTSPYPRVARQATPG